MDGRYLKLNEHIARGEAYLAANPNDEKGWEAMARLLAERERFLLPPVTLALPDGVAYQPNGSAEVYSTVRVIFSGKREQSFDVTKEELAAMLEDVKLARGAMNG